MTARRRASVRAESAERELAVVRQARAELRQLPTANLRRMQELLERALSERGDEADLIAQLQLELGRRR